MTDNTLASSYSYFNQSVFFELLFKSILIYLLIKLKHSCIRLLHV